MYKLEKVSELAQLAVLSFMKWKSNGLAFLLLNYPVFNLTAPKGLIALKQVFRMWAADHANFSFILLKKIWCFLSVQ